MKAIASIFALGSALVVASTVLAADTSSQPLTRADCSKAGMRWNEGANVCTESASASIPGAKSPGTRFSGDGYRENNVARNNGIAYSSGPYPTQPVWTINDGRRGSPHDASISQYAYWASSTTSTIYNCNYGNWWVSVDFQPEPGTICPVGLYGRECVRSISEVDLFSLQDNYWTGTDPTTSTVTTNWGNVDFHLQYCRQGLPCYPNGSGWVDVPGGYVIANNKAWTKVSFAPVQATAVRAMLDCAQSTRANVVELEAWERITPPNNCATFATIPNDNVSPKVGDDNSTAAIIADSDRFWWTYFGNYGDTQNGCQTGSPNGVPDDIDGIDCWLKTNSGFVGFGAPGGPYVGGGISVWWFYSERVVALVEMYDLLAPVDFQRALVYLERLRQMSYAFLYNRDDKRTGFPNLGSLYPYPQPPYDPFHGRVMPAWGSVAGLDAGTWNGTWLAQVDMSGLFTYAMAAFARRVAEHPDWFCLNYRQDAIKFTTAVLETYGAFRGDMRFSDPSNAAWGYYVDLDKVSPSPFNVTLSSLRPIVEVASAADSELYRSSSEGQANWAGIYYATQEGPHFIAENVKFFLDHLKVGPAGLGGGTTWYWWRYMKDGHPTGQFPENLSHASWTLAALLLVWENRGALDGLLARYGFSQRVEGPTALSSTTFNNIANTFLRRIWYNDYTPGSDLHNLLTDRIDGPYSHVYPIEAPFPTLALNGNAQLGVLGAGFVGLAQFNRWVWVRSRDSVFNSALASLPDCQGLLPAGLSCMWPALSLGGGNHAALLRYRAWW